MSTWDPNLLEEILENLAKTANPNKTEITQGGQRLGSNDAGNGLEDTIWKHLVGDRERERRFDGTQPNDDEK